MNCQDGEGVLSVEVSITSGDDGTLAFTQLDAGDWGDTAVRKILHAFAYGGSTTDSQIALWAGMPADLAIVEMLTFDPVNEKLSPSEDASSQHAYEPGGSAGLLGRR